MLDYLKGLFGYGQTAATEQRFTLDTISDRDLRLDGKDVSKAIVDNFGQRYRYNPDELVTRKGLGIYDDMRNDDIIKPLLSIKKNLILSQTIDFEPASQDAVDVQACDYIKFVLKSDIQTPFRHILNEVLTAYDFGFSVSEKLYKIIEYGDFSGKIGLRNIKTRNPINFHFAVDDYGNIKPKGIMQNQMGKEAWLDPMYFWIYTNEKEFSNWYGRSDLRPSYRYWWAKDIVLKLLCVHLERFSTPLIIAKHPERWGTTDADSRARKEELQKRLKLIQHSTFMRVTDDVKIDAITFPQNSGYESAINLFNKSIARSLSMPDLMGFSDTTSGSYALGKEQFNLLYLIIDAATNYLETSINENIIVDLVDKNFNVKAYPIVKFTRAKSEDLVQLSGVYKTLKDIGVINLKDLKTINIVRQKFNLPLIEEEQLSPLIQEAKTNPTIPARMEEVMKNLAEIKTMFAEAGPEPINSYLDAQYPKLRAKLLTNVDQVSQEIFEGAKKLYTDLDLSGLDELAWDSEQMKKILQDQYKRDFSTGSKSVTKIK